MPLLKYKDRPHFLFANVTIEARVHHSLLTFLRRQGQPYWQHHLTMARLVARSLRLGRSLLLQTGCTTETYCFSYLSSALLWDKAVILVTPPILQQKLLQDCLPQLLQGLEIDKEILISDRLPSGTFKGLLLTSPQSWLRDRLDAENRFPDNIPTLIDPADDWEDWTREELTVQIRTEDWQELRESLPDLQPLISQTRDRLSQNLCQRPHNPHNRYAIAQEDTELLATLFAAISGDRCPPRWQKFLKTWQKEGELKWLSATKTRSQFTLNIAPIEVATVLEKVWQKQPIVIMGGFLDWDDNAPIYRQQLGLGDLTCVQFSPHRQSECIQLYLPDRLPLPNTKEFQSALLQQVVRLCRGGMLGQNYHHRHQPEWISAMKRPAIVLVEDTPLRRQVGATLAAEFGSGVQVEQTNIASDGILVSGWEFWRSHQDILPTPQLLIIATLPFPSTENPLVAARVAYYKNNRQDWFRNYMLPVALRELQRAVLPLRDGRGVVALLDNRVNHRSYGNTILAALEPLARINYIDW
ncbi:helicase C-terminal domain-containing protein [Spirulina sp. 06S082]|uniref:helicase C-terminal domain-containing protein n=1 Tax=Spirulina sp. 06S082 TaxID=3110248 RepID=UPI002B1EB675|nr:helicase C-terminal domain-containing protein [Spirulina sp. 06S082]MEA5472170.1 helicase C-terminal domain-containing protein [Spirulina sp. 06S082]